MDRLSYWIYCLLSWVAALLPLESLCRLGSGLGLCAYYLLPTYRRIALSNLQIAFGADAAGPVRTSRELRVLARQHFSTLGGNLLSSLKLSRMSPDEILKLVEIEGLDIPSRLNAEGRGTVFIIGHLGNWELFAQMITLVLPFPLGSIYQRLGNPYMDGAIRRERAKRGLQLFERKEGFQGATRLLREAGGVGVLSDQHAGDAGVWCPFFGRLASTTSLPATLALRTGAAIVSATMYTVRPGRWRMVMAGPIAREVRDVDAMTARVNLELEARIRQSPADWFWVHNRWKTPRPKFLLTTYKRGVVPPQDGRPLQPFRILIRSTNWLGDAVMTVPAVRAIKQGRPDAHVTILAPAKLRELWQAVPEVDDIIAVEKRDGVFGVARRISGKFAVAIVFPNSLRAGLEVWLANIDRRVGYPGHRRVWLLDQPFRPKKKKRLLPPKHQVEHYLRLAEFVGAETSCCIPEAGTSSGETGSPRVAVCPGAEYGPAKRWPAERFATTMREVSSSLACEWVLVGVAKDAPFAEAIVQGTPGLAVNNLVGKTGMTELIAELRRCRLLLTNDTGTMHLAAMLGIPVVAIFGSTEPALTGPLGSGHQVLRQHVECSPCFLRECPLDFRCMEAISPVQAAAAVLQVLASAVAK